MNKGVTNKMESGSHEGRAFERVLLTELVDPSRKKKDFLLTQQQQAAHCLQPI